MIFADATQIASDAGVWLAAVVALFCVIGGFVAGGRWINRALRIVIKEEITPQLEKIHERIDDHMAEESASLDRVGTALEVIAAATDVHLPPSLLRR